VIGTLASAAVSVSAPARPAPLAERLDAEAFRRFHAEVAPRLWAYVRSHVADRGEADDLAQEAFTRVLASTFTPESDDHLVRYLYRTAGNLLRDRGRAAARGTTVPLDEAERGETPRPAVRIDLERALRALRPRDRELLWLAHVEGIEQRAIDPICISFYIRPARQHPVEAIHEHGDDHPRNGRAPILFEDRQQGQESPDRAGSCEQMHTPGKRFLYK